MIQPLYDKYLSLTGEPGAAATLVLAEVLANPNQTRLLSVRAASIQLGVGCKKVYELCESGDLKSQKIGRQIRILEEDVHAFLAAGKVEAPTPGRLLRV